MTIANLPALLERLNSLRDRVHAVCDSDTRPLLIHWSDTATLNDTISLLSDLELRISSVESALSAAIALIRP